MQGGNSDGLTSKDAHFQTSWSVLSPQDSLDGREEVTCNHCSLISTYTVHAVGCVCSLPDLPPPHTNIEDSIMYNGYEWLSTKRHNKTTANKGKQHGASAQCTID